MKTELEKTKVCVQTLIFLPSLEFKLLAIATRDGSRFSNIRLVDLIIKYQLGCGIIF